MIAIAWLWLWLGVGAMAVAKAMAIGIKSFFLKRHVRAPGLFILLLWNILLLITFPLSWSELLIFDAHIAFLRGRLCHGRLGLARLGCQDLHLVWAAQWRMSFIRT